MAQEEKEDKKTKTKVDTEKSEEQRNKDKEKKEKAEAKAERLKSIKKGFFTQQTYRVLRPFMELFRFHKAPETSSLYKKTIHNIGLDYNISLLKDISSSRKQLLSYFEQ